MKRKAAILLSVLLLLMTVFCQPIAGSSGMENDNNVPVAPNIAQSAWYTKKIELNGYGNKAIEGKLHFKLTPYPVDENEATYPIYDTSGLEEGEDPSHGYLQETIKIVPGLTSYSYEVPFSSDDFVDKQFNDLVERSADKNGNTTELFNYALLHEWGRMAGTDWGNVACVGKIDRGQFPEGEAGDSAYQAALENEDYQVTWGG